MAGYGQMPMQMQGPPSMQGMGAGEAFDDGGSVAGSAMTFMDGAMGGRTSQYGLPKYPHQAKPDPRR
jgi:sorting nexin-25